MVKAAEGQKRAKENDILGEAVMFKCEKNISSWQAYHFKICFVPQIF